MDDTNANQINPSIRGLTENEVKKRIEKGLTNQTDISTDKTTKEIILSNTLTYFNLIFLIITVLLILVGSFRNLTFLPIIIGNTLIGIIQELRAKKTLEKMNFLNAPHADVVRDGVLQQIRSEELVKDDVILLTTGKQICADAVVIDGSIQVNESLLTGEADEVEKTSGSSLLSGSFVVSGECYARLEKVGNESYISKLSMEAKTMGSGEQSEMIRSINLIVKWVGIIIIPIGIILFWQSHFVNDDSIRKSVTSTVAAILGMIPEGLYLLTTIALALSTMNLAKRKVLLHDMKSIETLARVDVLCVDKTGTITEPGMHVYEVEILDGLDENATCKTLADVVKAQNKDNATMEALQAHFTEGGGMRAKEVFSFSSETKFSGAIMDDGKSYVIGAPEFVLRNQFDEYQEQIAEYSSKGYRVLVFLSLIHI